MATCAFVDKVKLAVKNGGTLKQKFGINRSVYHAQVR